MPFVVKLKTFLSSVSVMKKQGHGLSLWLLALVTGDMRHMTPSTTTTTATTRLCPTKSWSYSFRDQNNNKNYERIIFSHLKKYIFFSKQLLFQKSIQPLEPLIGKQLFCGTEPLKRKTNAVPTVRIIFRPEAGTNMVSGCERGVIIAIETKRK